MKMIMVTPRFVNDIRGGGEISCKLLVDNLRKLGIRVDVFSGDEIFPNIKDTIKLNTAMYLYLKKKKIWEYDIVHTYNMSLLPTIGKLTKKYNLQSVGTLNGHVFSPTFEKQFSDHPLRSYNICKFLLKTQIRHIKQFTVLSKCWGDVWINDGIPSNKIQVIQNMMPENYKSLKATKNNTVNLLVVGNTAIWRNVKLILDAYSTLPKQDIKLTLVGIGWKKEIAAYKGENEVVYLGYTKKEILDKVYALADIYIQAFEYTGMGRSMLEAALNKTALVANGEWEDFGKLSSAINFFSDRITLQGKLQLLINNKKIRDTMGEKAAKIVNTHFTPEVTAKKYKKLYEEMLC